ncbi:Laminin subunit alpha-5 [Varanus komodoensis]|nr:Laminin subunit alpha-5 [Varanus komodoensis]
MYVPVGRQTSLCRHASSSPQPHPSSRVLDNSAHRGSAHARKGVAAPGNDITCRDSLATTHLSFRMSTSVRPYCVTFDPAGFFERERDFERKGESADPHLHHVFPLQGSCECRAYVEGEACDRCKPLYWNLTPDNPFGCISCQCDTMGTIAGVAECQQGNGHCFCKPNICGQFCSTCKKGYYNLDGGSYFGCQVSASVNHSRPWSSGLMWDGSRCIAEDFAASALKSSALNSAPKQTGCLFSWYNMVNKCKLFWDPVGVGKQLGKNFINKFLPNLNTAIGASYFYYSPGQAFV